MNRGKISKRRALIGAELTRAESNKRRSDGRKRKPEMGPWRDVTFADGSVCAEPPVVPLIVVLNLHDVEVVDQNAA